MTKDQAVAVYESRWWIGRSDDEIVKVQLFERLLCTDFSVFHAAMNRVLGRPVFTHEFMESNVRNLQAEYLRERDAPSFDDICRLVDPQQLIVVEVAA